MGVLEQNSLSFGGPQHVLGLVQVRLRDEGQGGLA